MATLTLLKTRASQALARALGLRGRGAGGELVLRGPRIEVTAAQARAAGLEWGAVCMGAHGAIRQVSPERLLVADQTGGRQYNVRFSQEERDLVVRAAAVTQQSIRAFMHETLIQKARKVLATAPPSLVRSARAPRRTGPKPAAPRT